MSALPRSYQAFVAFRRPIPKPARPTVPSHVLEAGHVIVNARCRIHELAYYMTSLWRGEANARFRGYELPVYARRGATDDARLCRPAGGALRHYPRAMGSFGQGRTHRGPEAIGTRRADGNAADHADAT